MEIKCELHSWRSLYLIAHCISLSLAHFMAMYVIDPASSWEGLELEKKTSEKGWSLKLKPVRMKKQTTNYQQ